MSEKHNAMKPEQPARLMDRRGAMIAVGIASVVIVAIASAGHGGDKPGGAAKTGRRVAATATATATPTPDPATAARRTAERLAARGRFAAAVAVLDAAGQRGPLFTRLRRRGSQALMRRARAALAASHEAAARRYARRARALGAGAAASEVIRTADAQAATERALARERRRLAAIQRDQRTCTAGEKATVDAGGATPPGCDSYAARQAQPTPTPTSSACDPSYKGACLNPKSPDYDCAGGSGNGPDYVEGPIQVVGDDHYDLDRDGDGIACEP